jgi:putative membrane protein
VDQQTNPDPNLIGGSMSNELASQRTALAFDRTAIASDRTLMAVVRTSLALIGFGFTIYKFFHDLSEKVLPGLPPAAPRRFGLALIVLGVVMLVFGILNHRHDTSLRRARRQAMFEEQLIHHPEIPRANSAQIVAVLLLIVGVLAILRVALNAGPF